MDRLPWEGQRRVSTLAKTKGDMKSLIINVYPFQCTGSAFLGIRRDPAGATEPEGGQVVARA